MTQYLLSVYTSSDADPSSMTDEERQRGFDLVAALESEMKAAGALLFSGRLAASDTATVVNASTDKPIVTDGPFVESKEQIGGFYILEARDLDAALQWATRTSEAISMPIEVRAFYAVAQRQPARM